MKVIQKKLNKDGKPYTEQNWNDFITRMAERFGSTRAPEEPKTVNVYNVKFMQEKRIDNPKKEK